jgi:hypothetical protein
MERALPLAMSERMELAVRLAICLLPVRCNAGMRFWVRWIECSLLILALANCYFAHDSSGFPSCYHSSMRACPCQKLRSHRAG